MIERMNSRGSLGMVPEELKEALFNQGIRLYMKRLTAAQDILEKSLHFRPEGERQAVLDILNGPIGDVHMTLFRSLRLTPELDKVFGDVEAKWIELRDRKKRRERDVGQGEAR